MDPDVEDSDIDSDTDSDTDSVNTEYDSDDDGYICGNLNLRNLNKHLNAGRRKKTRRTFSTTSFRSCS